MPTPADYAWINDSVLSEAACVAVVPAADRAAVLAAYGAAEESEVTRLAALDVGVAMHGCVIQVVEVGDALIVIEDNGFEATRPEVLAPLSRASRWGAVAAFFWNVNAITSFTAASDGDVDFAIELLGTEDGDEELDDVPAHLRSLVVEGGSEDGDVLGAGLALVASHTATSFTAAVLDSGRFYEIEPTPAALTVRTQRDFDPLAHVRGATAMIETLPGAVQRALAEWAAAAAVRESGLDGDPVVRQVLDTFGRDGAAAARAPEGLDQLARTTAREHDRFVDLERDLEHGGRDWPAHHPWYEAVGEGVFEPRRAISHLEGCYLGQRRSAAEALRRVTNDDPFSAAVDCVARADAVFAEGRTTRDWTFDERPDGRWRSGTLPGPRHQQFVRVLTALLSELAPGTTGPDVWRRADAALPPPLSAAERSDAIRADAEADLRGDFATYQVMSVEGPDDEADDWDGWDGWDEDDEALEDNGTGRGRVVVATEAGWDDELDGDAWLAEMQRLDRDVRRHDAMLLALARPADVLAAVAAAPTALLALGPVAATLGLDDDQALAVLGVRLRRATLDDQRRLQAERDALAARLADLGRR